MKSSGKVESMFVCCLFFWFVFLLYLFIYAFKQQHEKWTAILEQIVFSLCKGSLESSHLIKAMIEEDNLGLLAVGTLSNQHIAWVWVTVDKAMYKDHFTVHLTQVL